MNVRKARTMPREQIRVAANQYADDMAAKITEALGGGGFTVTAPKPLTLAWVVEVSDLLGIDPVEWFFTPVLS